MSLTPNLGEAVVFWTLPTFFVHCQHCGPTTQQGLYHGS